MATLRDMADEVAGFIRGDEVLAGAGCVTVAVEDRADVGFAVQEAVGRLGVFVLVSVLSFRRADRSPVMQGTLEMQVSCFEHPSLNREDPGSLTAQGAAERIAGILHYRRFATLAGQMLVKDFSRDDADEANIVRINCEAHARLAPPAAGGGRQAI